MRLSAVLAMLILCLSACEKTIDLNPRPMPAQLVVDGTIETGQPPVIFLSRSLDYFSKISPEILNNSQVQNARVTISDGSRSSVLKEYALSLGNGYFLRYYSIDSSNLANAIIGQNGKTYTLGIDVDGNTYTSSTSIPVPRKTVDSLWWRKPAGDADSNKAVLMARVTDPPGYGNYIRYFTKTNNGRFLPGANSAYDDQIVDGRTYDIQVDQGIDRNDPPDFEDYGFFNRGDTATVKFCNIDKATYEFWRTIEYSYQSIGNPFSSPSVVLGNVNGALGAFCGYSVQYKTLVIPR